MFYKDVRSIELYVLQRCPFHRAVRFTKMSVLQKCRSIELYILQRCPLYSSVRSIELYVLQRYPLCKSAVLNSCPAHSGETELLISSKQLLMEAVPRMPPIVKLRSRMLVEEESFAADYVSCCPSGLSRKHSFAAQ